MDILVAHNLYKQPGGEDQCVAAEVAMVEAHGRMSSSTALIMTQRMRWSLGAGVVDDLEPACFL
jgi:hypothetical protein